MQGSTESQRFNAEQRSSQVGAAIHDATGNIVILVGGQPVFALMPKDLAAFVAGLCGLLSQHPQLQAAPQPVSPILVAGTVPPLGPRLQGR